MLPLRNALIVGDITAVTRILLDDPTLIKSSQALHVASSNELSESMVDQLIILGANVDEQDADGLTPLHRHVCSNRCS